MLPEACSVADRPWYVLRIETGREVHVAARLSERSIEQFLPSYHVTRRNARGHKERVQKALFPGYLFARFRRLQEVYLALNTPRVISLLQFDHQPAELPHSDIEELRKLVESGALEAESGPEVITRGQTVEVRYGPLGGQRGLVVRTKNARRIIVKIAGMFGRETETEIDPERLRVVKKAA